jgi:para-aminobenzoate synthetase component 1
VLEYIRAGDVYQVNLAHRLSYTFEGSTRELFQRLLVTASPWFGAYLEATDGARRHAVCSVSPELLFRIEGGTGRIVTRPMKGTRAPADGAAEALRESAKDQAELNMIVDLMRNDLGRVCEVGSVRVERGREVEWHGEPEPGSRDPATAHRATGLGILQATATVGGVVRAGLTVADVIRALVPGGSVTGAPKIRAMQIIDELEPMRRGPYCGAIGFVGDDGSCAMNVGIRTALIHGRADPASSARDAIAHGVMDYSVGAGIVADSAAESEWLETLEKAGVLRALDLG